VQIVEYASSRSDSGTLDREGRRLRDGLGSAWSVGTAISTTVPTPRQATDATAVARASTDGLSGFLLAGRFDGGLIHHVSGDETATQRLSSLLEAVGAQATTPDWV